ncbi:hypothetical protein [Salininema proteolyticum]|uniref:Uncharacterized protein n=1 Tax=Salininema proteolyticum TaxID=1607685 RepID=A0ABV8TVX4_9ACTN
MTETPLPFVMTTDPDWDRTAADTAEVSLLPEGRNPEQADITGPCPRCGHATAWTALLLPDPGSLADGHGLLHAILKEAEGPVKTRDVDVTCDCLEYHPGVIGHGGCGASWTVEVSWASAPTA